jgi:hypothetical protein
VGWGPAVYLKKLAIYQGHAQGHGQNAQSKGREAFHRLQLGEPVASVAPGPCPIEALLALADRSGADWLRRAVEDHIHREPIEIALGLAGAPGKPTARRSFLRRQRDRHLRTAWRAIEGAIGPWDRTLRLHAEIRPVEALWSTLRYRSEPPAHFFDVRGLVLLAAQTGEPLPGVRQLHDICNSSPVSTAELSGEDNALTSKPERS